MRSLTGIAAWAAAGSGEQDLPKSGPADVYCGRPRDAPPIHAIGQVGPSDANVLVTGEHGTGKEVEAQMAHAVSHRADKPLIIVNTGGLPEGIFESELFGHVRGAFTDANSDRRPFRDGRWRHTFPG